MERRVTTIAGIPACNEEATIAKVIIRAQKYVDRVVVIDDGSTDDTALIAEALGALVVRHKQRLGYGAAIRSCFKAAQDLKANVLVTLDADGQHDPDQMPRLIQPINDDSADLVLGSRFLKALDSRDAPEYRDAGIRLLTSLTETASRAQFSDAQSGYRAYGRKVFEQILPTEEGMGVSVEILMKATERNFRIHEVPVTVRYRGLRTSTHNPFYHALDVVASVVKFTSIRHPLIFYGGLATVAFVVCIAFGAWTVDLYVREGRIVTNLALISIGSGLVTMFTLFTGIILFTLISVVRERR